MWVCSKVRVCSGLFTKAGAQRQRMPSVSAGRSALPPGGLWFKSPILSALLHQLEDFRTKGWFCARAHFRAGAGLCSKGDFCASPGRYGFGEQVKLGSKVWSPHDSSLAEGCLRVNAFVPRVNDRGE